MRLVLHAGDVASPRTLALFRGFRGAVAFGNNDVDEAALARAARAIGWETGESWAGVLDDGTRIALAHGHRPATLKRLLRPEVDYLVRGHNHRVMDERVDGVRVLNPGALFRASRYTVGVLDTASGALEVVELPKVTGEGADAPTGSGGRRREGRG